MLYRKKKWLGPGHEGGKCTEAEVGTWFVQKLKCLQTMAYIQRYLRRYCAILVMAVIGDLYWDCDRVADNLELTNII